MATAAAVQAPRADTAPGTLASVLFGRRIIEVPALAPGLLLAAGVVAAAMLCSEALGAALGHKGLVSPIMMAIVLGLIVGNTVTLPGACAPGLGFCLTKLLRLGIILMGFRLSIVDAARIGAWCIPIIVICVATGLAASAFFTRLLRLPLRLGTLLAVGTSICGATAIVATAPAIQADEKEVAYAVANVTVFGILAMLAYPYLAYALFDGDVLMAGLFQGTAIHETAQVTGAALIYDQTYEVATKPGAADIAIVTKLVRNVFIALVVPLTAYAYARRAAARDAGRRRVAAWRLFPVFVLGFVAAAILRSAGDASLAQGRAALGAWSVNEWKGMVTAVTEHAGYALAMAMAGVGLNTRLSTLKGLGIRPFYVGLLTAVIVGVASAGAVRVFGPLVHA